MGQQKTSNRLRLSFYATWNPDPSAISCPIFTNRRYCHVAGGACQFPRIPLAAMHRSLQRGGQQHWPHARHRLHFGSQRERCSRLLPTAGRGEACPPCACVDRRPLAAKAIATPPLGRNQPIRIARLAGGSIKSRCFAFPKASGTTSNPRPTSLQTFRHLFNALQSPKRRCAMLLYGELE